MPFPIFLTPTSSLNLHPSPQKQLTDEFASGGAAPTVLAHNFQIQPQLQSKWCWAAVSASVSHYFDPMSAWTQCSIADATLSRSDCCSENVKGIHPCNVPNSLNRAMTLTGNLSQLLQGTLDFGEVQAELGNNAPVGCRVQWQGGGAHVLVIAGCRIGHSGSRFVDLLDPFYGQILIGFDSFAASYQSGGQWTHSYKTKPKMHSSAEGVSGTGSASGDADATAIGA
jgi:hypothetical protein